MKQKISENVKVNRKSAKVTGIVVTLGKKVIQITCSYWPQSGRPGTEKVCIYNKMVSEWDMGSPSENIFLLEDFNTHVGNCVERIERRLELKRNVEGRSLLEFCDKR